MAKNVFFSEETMNGVNQLVEAGNGRTVVDYGKGNFLLGAYTAVTYGIFGWAVYEAVKTGVAMWKYLKS